MPQRAPFSLLTIIILLSQSMCALSWAQSGNPPQTPPSQGTNSAAPKSVAQAAALPAPISAASIASEAEAASFRLRRIRLDLDAVVKLSDVEEQLAFLTTTLQQIQPALAQGDVIHEEELFNLRQELARFSIRLKALQNELVPRSRVLEERREELRGMELLWEVTSQSLSRQEAPGSSRELIRSTQHQIDETVTAVRTYRPVLLNIQNRISKQRIAVDILLAQIGDAIDESRKRLFTFDSEPLWKAFGVAEQRVSVAESLRNSYLRRALPLFEYLRDNRPRLWVHLLITSLLIWLLTVLSRGNRKWLKPTGGDRVPADVLRHPLAAALVVSLLLSFIIYPNPPLTLYRLPLLLMVLPLARVVSATFSRDELITFYFLAGLYVLARTDALFSSANLIFRFFVLVLACLGIFAALWGARVDRLASCVGIGPWRTARLHLLRIAAVILLGSVIANVSGSVMLAAVLANACIGSAYAGAAIVAGVLTLEGFILPLFHSPLAQRSLAIRERSQQFQRRSALLIRFLALIVWVGATLVFFSIFGPVLSWLSSVLARQWSLGRMAFSLGGILLFVATICVSVWAARFAALVCEKDILSRVKLPQGIPATASMLVRDLVIALGFVLALAGAGVQWSQIVLLASAIGVGIGFGLQHLVASFVAGLILIFERPIRVGDVIEVGVSDVGKMAGVVSRIGLRSCTIQSLDGSDLICPNNRLISQDLVNWTLSNRHRRVDVQVGVAFGSNAVAVLAVLNRVAQQHPEVRRTPEPIALFTGFSDSSMNFVLRFFTSFDTWVAVSSEVGIRINDELRQEGIAIPFPQRDIRIVRDVTVAPAKAKAISQECNP